MASSKEMRLGKEWIKKEMRPYRAFVIFLTVLTVTTTVFSLAFAYMTKFLINSATDKQSTRLFIFSAVLLGLLLLRIAIQTVSGYLAEKLRAQMVAKLRTKIFAKILRSDYVQTQAYHSGELINRLTSDIQEVVVDTVGLMPAVVGMLVQCLGAIAALLTINWQFTCFYVVCGGIFGGITAFFRKQIRKRQKEVLEADGASRSFMQESIFSVMTLKAYGAEEKTKDKAQNLSDIYYAKRMKRNVLRSGMSAVFSLLSNFGLIFAVIWCSVSILWYNNTDYGSILSVILLLMQLQHPFSAFSSVIPAYYSRLASAERLHEIDAMTEEILVDEQDKQQYAGLLSISFENISFSYGREPILVDANATVKTGEIVCLTGASGAGKSTLFKLLLSVYEPTSGAVSLTYADKSLPLSAKERGLFAYVPQGKFLFSGTIYENLTFFTEETNGERLNEKIRQALKTACAEFVWELPEGLQTPLTEGGGGLSEGQTQRLAVARAILSDRPILLLDEATSALDGETEKRLLTNIKNLKDKTCLIVTHRPAALDIADSTLTVENGKITRQ